MTRTKRRYFVGMVLFLIIATVSAAQWKTKTPPAYSIYWWTLTPELKPQELRQILLNVNLHRQRFRDSQDDGERSVKGPSDLYYFVDGSFTPELIRMSEAYDSFTSLFETRPEWESIVREAIPKYGVTPSGMDAVLATVKPKNEELEKRLEFMDRTRESVEQIFTKAEKKMSREALRSILRREDLQALSLASDRPAHELHLLLELWAQDPIEQVCIGSLDLLKATLSESDWDAFRAYLLAEVAPGMLIVEYRDHDDLLE